MKKTIFIMITITIIISIIGIYLIISKSNNNKNNLKNTTYNETDENNKFKRKIDVIINEKKYTLTLEDNDTTKELFKTLPLDFNMKELNGNEKYIYLDKEYPTNSSIPKHIRKGDVMLYENNCLVIFYKSFDTSYTYTKVGHIDNLEDLDNTDIRVKFNQTK